jgi:hypothetical protein
VIHLIAASRRIAQPSLEGPPDDVAGAESNGQRGREDDAAK